VVAPQFPFNQLPYDIRWFSGWCNKGELRVGPDRPIICPEEQLLQHQKPYQMLNGCDYLAYT